MDFSARDARDSPLASQLTFHSLRLLLALSGSNLEPKYAEQPNGYHIQNHPQHDMMLLGHAPLMQLYWIECSRASLIAKPSQGSRVALACVSWASWVASN